MADTLRFEDIFDGSVEKRVNNLRESLSDLSDTLNDEVEKSIEGVKKESKQLSTSIDQVDTAAEGAADSLDEMAEKTTELVKSSRALNMASKQIADNFQDIDKQLEETGKEAKDLTKQYKSLNKETEDGQRQAKELATRYTELKKRTKEVADDTRQLRQEQAKTSGSSKTLATNLRSLVKVVKTAGGPIKLLITGLTLLAAALFNFAKGGDAVKGVLTDLKNFGNAALGTITNLIQEGIDFGKIFSGDFSQVTDTFNRLKEAFDSVAEAQKRARNELVDLTVEQGNLEKAILSLEVQAGNATTSLNEQLIAARDLNKQRIEFAENEIKLANQRLVIASKELEAARKAGVETAEQRQAEADAIAEVRRAEGELNAARLQGAQEIQQIIQDQEEQRLDFLIDGTEQLIQSEGNVFKRRQLRQQALELEIKTLQRLAEQQKINNLLADPDEDVRTAAQLVQGLGSEFDTFFNEQFENIDDIRIRLKGTFGEEFSDDVINNLKAINSEFSLLGTEFEKALEQDPAEAFETLSDTIQASEINANRFLEVYREQIAGARDDTKDLTEDITNLAGTLADSILQLSELSINRIDQEISRLEDRYAREIELAGDNAEARELLEEELDVQRRKLELDQAKRRKRIAIFDIILSTAQAIAQASPNPFAIAAAAIVGATQLAIASAAPLPQFEEGTDDSGPEGLAVVGEQGSELVFAGGKAFLTPDKPAVVNLPAHSQVLDAKETADALEAFKNGSLAVNQTGELKALKPEHIDELGNKLESAFSKQKNYITSLNKGQIEYFVEYNGNKTKYYGKRYG